MKPQPFLALCALGALSTFVIAEPGNNPFVNASQKAPLPPPPAGASFTSLMESIEVPPDLLDSWLSSHPLVKGDAAGLRDAVQGWIDEGKARLKTVSLSAGIENRKTSNASILEFTYPTDFIPNGEGVWPTPKSFDTRNTGYSTECGIQRREGVTVIRSVVEAVEPSSSRSWHALIEKTRQEDDVFLPEFRTMSVTQHDPSDSESQEDPFAESTEVVAKSGQVPSGMRFTPGLVELAARFDQEPGPPEGKGVATLYFHRGEVLPQNAETTPPPPEIPSRLHFRALKVSAPLFSRWAQKAPQTLLEDAWGQVAIWEKGGSATLLSELSAGTQPNLKCTIERVTEFIYPTGWTRPKASPPDRKAPEKVTENQGTVTAEAEEAGGPPGMATPGSFDTRNLGTSVEARLSADKGMWLLEYQWNRIVHIRDSVFHRVQVDGEWIPDITMPFFTAQGLEASIRIRSGQWTLAGLGSHFDEKGKVDREHCYLLFVKAE